MYKLISCSAIAVVACAAAAQTTTQPDPADPKAKAPAIEYRSAFSDYRPYAEPELAPWRDANEAVGRGGGHAGMQRQGAAGKSAPKPPAQGERK